MGMFDDIRCHHKLPDARGEKHFQTKDFDCLLDQYEITEDGLLLKHDHCATHGKHTRLVEHCGAVRFYTLTGGAERIWLEYEAVFGRGRLKSIERQAR